MFCEKCYNIGSTQSTVLICKTCISTESEVALSALKESEKFIKSISDNWDCDSDAHRYGTSCRCCDAVKLLPIIQSAIQALKSKGN